MHLSGENFFLNKKKTPTKFSKAFQLRVIKTLDNRMGY